MSATSYVNNKFGDLNAQLKQFDSSPGNVIKPLSGGKRRKSKRGGKMGKSRKSKKSKKSKRGGGLWGQIINQAIVPLSIFGMQQSYRRKPSYKGKNKSFRRR